MATIKQITAMSADLRDLENQRQLAKLIDVPVSTEFFSAMLKNWQTKLCGPKPTLEMVKLNKAIDGGRRDGVEIMWLAMTLRPDGATVGEYMRATSAGGAAHNNAAKYNTERNGAGWFVRVPLPNSDRAGRWQHVITDKGIAQLNKRIATLTGTEAKPVKPAAVVKAKAKVKTAKKAVSEAKVELTAAANAAPVETTMAERAAADDAAYEQYLATTTPEQQAADYLAAEGEPVTPEALAALAERFSK